MTDATLGTIKLTASDELESPARRQGQECQSCHMAPTGRMTNIAPGHGGLERDPWTLANHRFFDGSQIAMLRRCLNVTVVLTPETAGVRAEVTADEVRSAGTRAPAIDALAQCGGDRRIARETEVVVAREREEWLAVDDDARPLRGFERAPAALEPVGAPPRERSLEIVDRGGGHGGRPFKRA